MTLLELESGKTGTISHIEGNDDISLRLMSVGFFKGATLNVLFNIGNCALIKVGNTKVALSSYLLNRIKIITK